MATVPSAKPDHGKIFIRDLDFSSKGFYHLLWTEPLSTCLQNCQIYWVLLSIVQSKPFNRSTEKLSINQWKKSLVAQIQKVESRNWMNVWLNFSICFKIKVNPINQMTNLWYESLCHLPTVHSHTLYQVWVRAIYNI